MEGPYMNGQGSNQKYILWGGEIRREEYAPLLEEVCDLARVWAIDPAREGIEGFMADVRERDPQAIFAMGHSHATAADCRRVKKYGVKVQTHHGDSGLFRWDITRGGKPEWMGICGTKDRSGCWTSELRISKDDIMYITGSNHAADGPDITAVDLKKFRGDMYNFGDELLVDEYYVNPNSERYEKMADMFFEQEEFGEKNPWNVGYPLACKPSRLWRALAPDHVEDSCIKALAWEDDVTLVGVCGNEKEYVFRTVNGEITELVEKEQNRALYEKLMAKAALPEIKGLPYYPGRQYLAVASACVNMGDKKVVGTKDGMLAVCDGDKVFGLGTAVYNGPIRCLCATPDGKKVYGVGGHDDDMGMVFSYDEIEGLRWLGHVSYAAPSDDGAYHCSILSSCAISPDGKRLAIGSDERLGQILYYTIA